MRTREHVHSVVVNLVINVFLVAVILGMYFCLSADSGKLVSSRRVVYRGNTDSNAVAFQFIVSWDSPKVRDILRVLQEHDVRATFFVTGDWAAANSDTLCDMVELGHEVGTLGMLKTFNAGNSSVSADALRLSLAESVDAIEQACDVKPLLFFPGSIAVGDVVSVAEGLNLSVIACTIDLMCARGDARDIISRAARVSGGSIVLMSPTAQCVEALPMLIRHCSESGLVIAVTGALFLNGGSTLFSKGRLL